MEDTGKIIWANDWLEAVMAGGGDMVCPVDDPCDGCDPASCYGCPFDESE